MKKQMKTGDLILYAGKSLVSSAITCITGLPFSSLGMVIRLPDKYTKKERLYVIEVSDDSSDIADAYREDKQGMERKEAKLFFFLPVCLLSTRRFLHLRSL